jgi:RHS repeat-associated protein
MVENSHGSEIGGVFQRNQQMRTRNPVAIRTGIVGVVILCGGLAANRVNGECELPPDVSTATATVSWGDNCSGVGVCARIVDLSTGNNIFAVPGACCNCSFPAGAGSYSLTYSMTNSSYTGGWGLQLITGQYYGPDGQGHCNVPLGLSSVTVPLIPGQQTPCDRDNNPSHSGQATSAPGSDPVNLGNAVSFFGESDLEPPQPSAAVEGNFPLRLTFDRYQSSANIDAYSQASIPGSSNSLTVSRGDGWTHNYNIQLLDLSGRVIVTDWQGGRRSFYLANGVYRGDGTSTLTLTNGTYVWQLPHGTRYVFPGSGPHLLSNVTDRAGNSIALLYDSSNLLTGAVDSAGRRLSFSYNSSNELVSVVDPIGRTNSYSYDAAKRLISVSDSIGTKTRYVYDSGVLSNAVVRYINGRGYTNSFSYNSLRQVVSETNGLGNAQTYNWVGTNQQVTVTQFDGASYTIYNDATGAVTARVDAAGVQLHLRDDKHRATNTIDRLGHSTLSRYDTNTDFKAVWGNLLMKVDALGRTNSWSYEPTFNFATAFTNAVSGVMRWSYDSKGNLVTNIDAAGQVSRYAYDSSGNRISFTDANNHMTTFGYDQYNNRTNITDALGHATGFTHDLVGRLTGRTDALGRSESFAWDDRDRLMRQVNAANETNSWSYDGSGNQIAWINPLGNTRSNSYDALDRLVTTTLPGDSTAFLTYGYDDANNRVSVTDALGHQTKFGYDAIGRLTSITNALNKVWLFAVDAEGRRIRSTDPNGHSQGFVFDAVGQLTVWTNALTQVATFGYDKLGNLTSVTDSRNNALIFGYDAVSRLTDITYAGGSTEHFHHDGVGNVTGIVTRAGQTIALTYDAVNRLTQKSYVGSGDVVSYGYDNANQLTGIVAAVSGGNSVLAFAYDAAGRLTNEIQTVGQASSLTVGYEFFADGHRKKLIYPDGTFITYEYNAKGWLTAIRDGGTNTIVSYDYDAAGRRTGRTLENNTFTVYDYDAANQLTSIWHQKSGGGTLSRYQYGYDAAGNRTNMVGTSGSLVRSEWYSFDAADQLIGVTYKTSNAVDRIVTYSYDAAGNRTGMVERVGNATNTTSYATSNDNQLTSVATTRHGLTVTGYVDPGFKSNKWYTSTASARGVSAGVSQQNGNFALPGVPVTGGANALTVTVTDVSGNIATQVVNFTVISGSPVSVGYDGNGNQTNENGWAFAYDRQNRLTSASSASLSVNYAYDGRGRLVERRTSGSNNETNRFYYAGGQLIAEYNGAGVLQRKYVYGVGIDEILRLSSNGTNYYYHVDGLGSVTEITGSTGNKIESYSYDVYGTPTVYAGNGAVTNASRIANRLLFAGRDRDSDTGWYNYRHRYYNPSLGRFVQPDPLRMSGSGVNLYRYCVNDPVNYRDPAGLRPDGLDDPWFDRLGNWSRNRIDEASDWLGNNLPWQLAGALNTLMEIGQGTLGLPQALGHLGEGTGKWWGDPTLENFAGVCNDVSLVAGTLAAGLGALEGGKTGATTPGDKPASTPVGRSRDPINVVSGSNEPTTIAGRDYTGHALDQMQGRGIPPSVVENTVQNGVPSVGNKPGTTVFYDSANNVTVVTDTGSGRVITVHQGPP